MENKRKKYNLLKTIKHNSLSGNKRNFIKCWGRVSYNHFIVMCSIVWKLINQGYEVFTEVTFNNGKRADIVAISLDNCGYIIEVLESETDKRFNQKLNDYPIEWEMIKVNCKDFSIEKWEL